MQIRSRMNSGREFESTEAGRAEGIHFRRSAPGRHGSPAERKGPGGFRFRGQQRSCLLSLYFAQMEIHRKTCGSTPSS